MRALLLALALVGLSGSAAAATCVESVCADGKVSITRDQVCVFVFVQAVVTHGNLACTLNPCPDWICVRAWRIVEAHPPVLP